MAEEHDLNWETRRKEYMERIQEFCLMDDTFMAKVFEDKASAELLLTEILERTDLEVRQALGQFTIKNLQGRGVRLDILAVDQNNTTYNIEVQNDNDGAVPKRARYNSALLDANITDPGADYEQLVETYVIFITRHDALGGGRQIYYIERTIQGSNLQFGDGSHIVYVNGEIQNDTRLGRLIHDLHCKNPNDMYYNVLAQRVRYFKEDKEGTETMCKAMDELCDKIAREEVRAVRVQIACSFLADGDSYDKIAKNTGLTLEEVIALDNQRSA